MENNRIQLRHLKLSDLDQFHEYRCKPSICKFQGFSPMDRIGAKAFILNMQDAPFKHPGHWCQLAIWSKEKQCLVGDCALIFQAYEPQLVEIGCTLNDKFQGQGFAVAAMELLCTTLFEEYGVHKIKASMDARNHKAMKLVTKLGFSKEGHLRQNFFDEEDQEWIDELYYGKLRQEH